MKFECFTTSDEENRLNSVSHFAITRNVEELILIHHYYYGELPKLLFNIASLVRLDLHNFSFQPNDCVKWGRLKALELTHCPLSDEGIQNGLLGSPLLESLQLIECRWLDPLVISSKSLQELIIFGYATVTEISCPNLQKLMCNLCRLRGQVIQNISSSSPLLKSLKLTHCRLFGLEQLGISSKSLKRLSLGDIEFYIDVDDDDYGFPREEPKLFEISCPNLEKLKLSGEFDFLPCTIMNLPLLARATLSCWSSKSWVDGILQQLENVEELTICHSSLKVLSNAEETCMSSPLLNKSLILKLDCLGEHYDGIVWALQNFRVLEELSVKLPESQYTSSDSNENFWDSCSAFFGCLESHLRVVKIMNISERNGQCEVALDFIEFLLKNGRMLEKLVVILKQSEANFRSEVYRKLLSFQKCSKHVVIGLV